MGAGLTDKLPVLEPSDVPSSGTFKPSLYNHFVEQEDVVWGINFLSRAFIKISPKNYRRMQALFEGSEPLDGQGALQESLIEGKFLIPETMDEIQWLKVRNHRARFGSRGLTLIIAPTLRCNFGCEYCYVDLNANKMKPEDRVKLSKFVDRKLNDDSALEIVWTGGDPSLAMDVVEDLSLRFLDSCERKNCKYNASLITNAYLLNEKMRRHLRNSEVGQLQVSLDGSKPFHDVSRKLVNGKPTYDRVMANVEDTCEEFLIFLRVNVDANNYPGISDLLDDLEGRNLKDRLYLYFAHVDDVNENSSAYHDDCLPVERYAQVESELVTSARARGFRVRGHVLAKSRMTYCGANSQNYFVVDSKANLLKCYHDFGQADKLGIGHIGDQGEEVVTNPYNLMKFLGWDPFEMDECRNCKVLPQCMGGCSHKIMNSGMQVERGCLRLRFTMDEIVLMMGEKAGQGQDLGSGCSGCAEAVQF